MPAKHLLSAAALADAAHRRVPRFKVLSGEGGVGVASSRYVSAGWANPALLTSAAPTERFGLIIPAAGVRAYDATDLANDVDAFVDSFEALDNNPLATAQQFAGLGDQLTALGGRRVNSELGGGLAFAMPSDKVAWSIHAQNYTDLQLFAKIARASGRRRRRGGDP